MAALAILPVAAAVALPSVAHSARGSKKILKFDMMAPVQGPFVGTPHPVRGIPGGGLPWDIRRASGELRANGRLKITVKGLVLSPRDPVPPNLQGTNPVAQFVGRVNCLTPGSPDTGVTVSARPVKASVKGNARINRKVALPEHCVAPIVFVTSPSSDTAPNGAWFAATGR